MSASFVPMSETDLIDALNWSAEFSEGVLSDLEWRSLAAGMCEHVPAEEVNSSIHLALMAARDDNMSQADRVSIDQYCHEVQEMMNAAIDLGAVISKIDMCIVVCLHNTNGFLAEIADLNVSPDTVESDPWSAYTTDDVDDDTDW